MSFRLNLSRFAMLSLAGVASFVMSSCSNSTTAPSVPPQYTNAVIASDRAGSGAMDPNLKNPWGITYDLSGALLAVALNHSALVTYYSTSGTKPGGSVTVPSPTTATGGGTPTGVIQNTAFNIPGKGKSAFIYVGEDGVISAWGNAMGASPAAVVANKSATAVYKGAVVQGNFLYAANFKAGTIDLFDTNFVYKGSFPDNFQVQGYAPFNIASIDGKLYVTSARPKNPAADGSVDDSAGTGIGYVAVYNTDANNGLPSYSSTFASGGGLNSPWGIVKSPDSFGQYKNDILVGNFGDGKINVYETGGKSLGQLNDASNVPIVIGGLWGLLATNAGNGRVYYTAGTNGEADGTLGYIQVKQ